MGEDWDWIRDSYCGNDDRMVRIKGRYDPDNTFRVNQNIQPDR
jgi:FAD/FMN-containing dehydrogenase